MAERENLERYDQRLVEFHIRNGLMSRKDYEQYLKKLPDSEAIATYIDPFQDESTSAEGNAKSALTFTAVESGS